MDNLLAGALVFALGFLLGIGWCVACIVRARLNDTLPPSVARRYQDQVGQ